jgi:hypothetical protein
MSKITIFTCFFGLIGYCLVFNSNFDEYNFSMKLGKPIQESDYPNATISNNIITAKIHLPDSNSGYYQGTRFDWSGVMPELRYNGHQYFGKWNMRSYKGLHDAITGPVEEFMPLGYNEAKIGEPFVKIGVGALTKIENKPYRFGAEYKFVDRGIWTSKSTKNAIVFKHEMDQGNFPYCYIKKISLSKGKPEMIIHHELKNTGSLTIETSQYNHNFFVIDNELTGPNIVTTFTKNIMADGDNFGEIAKVVGKSITYERELGEKEHVQSLGVLNDNGTALNYDINILNKKSGAGVRLTSTEPIQKLIFWACRTTSCPEPYIKILIPPGQTYSWDIVYSFYSL